MEYHQSSSATAFSNKLPNGGVLAGKHVYDGIFGCVSKPGSRMEDYREIFGGSSACSIPVLDFPELKDRKASVDARSSKPDYSRIFGGFAETDFAVPYEQLFSKPKKVKNSSQEARAAAKAKFCPAGPEHFNVSEQKKAPSAEVSFQSLDGGKQINLSYDKSNPESKTGTNRMTHIAQLNTIPGYTCLIDEITPSQMTEGAKPVHTELNDRQLNVNVNEGTKQSKPLQKAVSGPQPRESAKNNSRNHANFQAKSSRNRSFSNDISFDAFEIGFGMQPSTVSPLSSIPNLGNNRDRPMRSMNTKLGVFSNDASEGATGSYSPPLLDEEIDANSAAATSAAAVRKAIEEAQAKIKIAKELMERKKEGLQNRVRPKFSDQLKDERMEIKAAEKANRSKEEEAKEIRQKFYTPKQDFTSLPDHNAAKPSHVNLEFGNAKKSSSMKNAVGETNSTESKLAQVYNRVEGESRKGTDGLSEPGDNSEHRAMILEVKQENNAEKMKLFANENKCKEKMTGEESIKKPVECDDNEKAPEQEKIKRELNSVEAAYEWNVYRNNIKSTEELDRHIENEEKIRVAYEHEEADLTPSPRVPCEQEEIESTVKKLHEPEENPEFEIQDLDENKDMKELKEAQNWMKIEKKQREAHNQEEMESRSNEVPVRQENESRLDEIHSCRENEKGQEEDLERVRSEMKQQEAPFWEENEKKLGVAKTEDAEKFVQVCDKDGSEKMLGEDCGTTGTENLEETKQNEEMLKEDSLMNESAKERTCEVFETESIQPQIHRSAEDESNLEATQQAFRYQENNLEANNDVYELDEKENAGKADEANDYGDQERFEHVKVTAEIFALEKNRKMMDMSEDSFPKETGKGSEAAEEANDLVEEENFGTGDPEQGLTGFDVIIKQTTDVYLGETDVNLDHKLNEFPVAEYERICELEKNTEEVTFQLDENDKDDSESEIGRIYEENESNFVSSHEERWSVNGIDSKPDSVKHFKEADCELGENNKDVKKSEVPKEDKTYFESSSEEKWINNRIDVQASQQPHTFEGEGMNMGISQEERTNQSTDKKEKYLENMTVEKRKAEGNLQEEMESEKRHHGRKEETKVRGIEKERIVVERAIREARERAFAEARERAEKAAAERAAAGAHQRVMAEARESLEKACAEGNGKSAAEKASMEAKLKAERAAVERATAEARERALERALSEKASFKARNQAEKFSAASRDAGIKSCDQQYKGSGPSNSSKYPSPSIHDGRYSGGNGESVERCKATLERNQRTAERAAKALAEKNMRDLLAQNEQAERNRLAETLDADVKRWSSGKERNLRALLSTLQYILGPDSGWQPIPLTDLISTAAVKKAYRKATLFVHPDKLQQRGASIQQKYTCEKVFDLLKDAWNKFSAEEW